MKGAIHIAILKASDEIAEKVGERNGLDMKFDEEVVNSVAALVWNTVSDSWADDLSMFASHAHRKDVQLEDVLLMTRRNPDLTNLLLEARGVSPKTSKSAKVSKRKRELSPPKPELNRSLVKKVSQPQPEQNNLLSIKTSTPQTKPLLKTSTPKSTGKPLSGFPDTITPIRRDACNRVIAPSLATIEESPRIESKSKKPNSELEIISLSATPSPEPSELQITHVDETIAIAPIAPNAPTEGARKEVLYAESVDDSDDSFDTYAVVTTTTRKPASDVQLEKKPVNNGVFKQKTSAFGFGVNDSFDEPVDGSSIGQQSTSKTVANGDKSQTPTGSRNKSQLRMRRDSFDDFDFDI